ncbi:DoxX-like family protein [Chitinophaga jiangningensis]|uniref:DoxX-like family protein n=1 Tax=Chitinophaga jiangningensis TaxID=1419482 RepID=A0A1M6Y615_9BACT|nr:DoxX family protein [Chitinophaga jiangningensis]SHL13671.1 DoxX-like family protein [Chitinophaga jiangningensis]
MEQTKSNSTLYWLAKVFISFFILFSAWFSYTHAEDLRQLGFPDYFRIELVIAKVLGAIVLLLPITPLRVKEWVYAGFMIAMISALIAHICSGDPLSRIVFVSVDLLLMLIAIRYVSQKELLSKKLSS